MSALERMRQAMVETINSVIDSTKCVYVIGDSGREEFRACEIGITFDGKMIYDNDKLVEHFAANDEMTEEDAQEWIDFNIVGSGLVLVV